MSLKPIKKVVVHEAIVEQILNYIKNEKLMEGEKLPAERKLAETLQVSRNSIREALRTLAAQNILEIRHGDGTYLKKDNAMINIPKIYNNFSNEYEMIKQLISIREMIETYGAIEVSKYITEEQINWLCDLAKKESPEKELKDEELDEIPNMNFEIAVTTLTNNHVLLEIHRNIEALWKKYWNEIESTPFTIETRYLDHIDIIEAIKKGKEEEIKEAIRVHLGSVNLILKK